MYKVILIDSIFRHMETDRYIIQNSKHVIIDDLENKIDWLYFYFVHFRNMVR